MTSVFLFHRDFRLVDNSALNMAVRSGSKILPVFIFNPGQIDEKRNPYFSHPSVQFMCESLIELDSELTRLGSRLLMLQGETIAVLEGLHRASKLKSLFCNRDFTVFAQERDSAIRSWCDSHSITYTDCEDYDFVPLNKVVMNEGTSGARPFPVMSQYFNKLVKDAQNDKSFVRRPHSETITSDTFVRGLVTVPGFPSLEPASLEMFYKRKDTLVQKGGRSNGERCPAKVEELVETYSNDRNFPALERTTQISAHLKFGTVSIREFFYAIVSAASGSLDTHLLREVVFRSFYYKLWTHQRELQREVSIHQRIDEQIPWKHPKDAPLEWKAWITGPTGFPLADAGMRQLVVEGYVHGRPRMVLATVATRYLLFDWRECAKYFAKYLSDYDPILNAAGWVYSCSLGDNTQYICRAPMNPFRQSLNYDPDCLYIKKWIPELKDVSTRDIHDWSAKAKLKYHAVTYPAPIVDQIEVSRFVTAMWKDAARAADPKLRL